LVEHQTTVVGEILDLKAFGCKTQGHDIARFMLQWTDDYQAVRIESVRTNQQIQPIEGLDEYQPQSQPLLSMQDFQHWVRANVEQAQRHLRDLFETVAVEPPTLPALATLHDSFTARQPGISFTTLAMNKARLESYAKAFVAKAQAQFMYSAEPTPKWNTKAFAALEAQHVQFLKSLLIAMQQTGGQPGRGPEFLSFKVCNTTTSLRNIYVHRALLCTLVSYNKTNSATQKVFWVARYLPACVSEILYYYLVLIRPLIRWLDAHIPGKRPVAEQPYYL
jgi:hypothetical protein